MASSPYTPEQVVARWHELAQDESVPYPLQLLAEEFGYDPKRVHILRNRLVRLGVPMSRLSTLAYNRDHSIGEIKFLRSAGRGVAEIASQLGWTVEQLVNRVHDWRSDGLVDFDYSTDRTWTLEDEQWKAGEFALGPKSRRGRAGQLGFRNGRGNAA